MKLYRPVGLKELMLILASEKKEFPPRLPDQPIFYPVLNREYAKQIAFDWNCKDAFSGYCGFITEFIIDDPYGKNFEVKTVGDTIHQEFWVPAKELKEFNRHIIGEIKITDAFYGEKFDGKKPL